MAEFCRVPLTCVSCARFQFATLPTRHRAQFGHSRLPVILPGIDSEFWVPRPVSTVFVSLVCALKRELGSEDVSGASGQQQKTARYARARVILVHRVRFGRKRCLSSYTLGPLSRVVGESLHKPFRGVVGGGFLRRSEQQQKLLKTDFIAPPLGHA